MASSELPLNIHHDGKPRAAPVILDVFLAVLVAGFGFTVRYLDHRDFANEQFITLSQAQAWLAGNWPIRDYTQYGSILTDGMSALAQMLFGAAPLSELILCVGALAVAAAITFWVTTRITGFRLLGAFAALLQIWAAPVLFAYPKLAIYPVLLALSLLYVRRQTRFRLILLAAWSATAFLIRQDHGVYAFIAGALLVASVHYSQERAMAIRTAQRAGFFVLAFLLFLTPFLVYVQAQMGLPSYVRLGLEVSRLEANRSAGSVPMFTISSAALLSRENWGAFLFFLCYLLPGFAFLLWWLTGRRQPAPLQDTRSLVPALCVLAMVCAVGLLRLETRRLPDVFGTFPILLCWSIATLLAISESRWRVASRAMAFVLIGLVSVGVYRTGGEYGPLLQETVAHPLEAFASAEETTRSAREWPWSAQWPEDEEWRLAVYVHDCTDEDDRLFVAWQAPEFFYFSRRVFAGREGAFLEPITVASRSLRFPETYEQRVLDSWQHQSVPIVLTSDSDQSDAEFATLFPALQHHLETAYIVAGTTTWRGRPSITVHVDKNRIPTRTDPEFGLPCFTEDPRTEQHREAQDHGGHERSGQELHHAERVAATPR